jgi:TonB-linked SusC/RagA family outer membrane protein
MKRILLVSFLLLGFLSSEAWAQRAVTGQVTDASSGEGLPGVAVRVKASGQGTVTDMDGNFRLEVPSDQSVLQFSFVGYRNREVTVGSQTVINVRLQEDVEQLEAVVVTALGFEESRAKIGSAVSTISGERINESVETGAAQSLAGKASGVQIISSSGDPGAGAYIQIRGQSTITSSVQPLIVLDGVPISNTNAGESVAGVTQQSRLNDINPNDIESVQVLKGASAAALWGSRVANGVIMITTKKGRAGQGGRKFTVTYNANYAIDQISYTHDLQTRYGQGSGGAYNPASAFSWGDRIDARSGGADDVNTEGQYFEAENGNRYYPILAGGKNDRTVYEQSNFDAVFRNGSYLENNISIGTSDENGSLFASFSNLDQQGIYVAGADYTRTTARINAVRNFTDIVNLKTNFGYTKINSNRIQKGSNLSGLYLGFLRNPADFDIRDYRGTYYNAQGVPFEGRQRSYRRYLGNAQNPIYNNPLWTLNEQRNPNEVDRFLSSMELNIDPLSWFGITARGGVDFYEDSRQEFFPIGSAENAGGGISTEQVLSERQLNLDVIGRSNFTLSDNLTLSAIIGFNLNERKYNNLGATIQSFILDERISFFGNATNDNRTPFDFESIVRTSAGYATATLGIGNSLFLNSSVRAESASTFGSQTNSTFIYPSADVAWNFVELPALRDSRLLNFGKLRAAYGQVGVQPGPYRTITDYVPAFYGTSWGGGLSASAYTGAFVRSQEQGNAGLEPERKTEWELGLDLAFLNIFDLQLTHYQNETRGALLGVDIPASTGFATRYANAATLENRGWEVDLGVKLLTRGDFNWTVNANWNRNRNEVTNLAGTESLFLAGFTGTSSRAVEGQPIGVLWGGRFLRDDAGTMILDERGFPQVAVDEGVIGDPNPDWRGGLGTTIGYKGLSLYALFETFQGGDIWAGTHGALTYFGRSQITANESVAAQELQQYTGSPIAAGTTFRGDVMDFGAGPVALTQAWYTSTGGGFGPVAEHFIVDGSWTRLREIRLGYRLDSEGFRNLTKLGAVEFGLSGRNLAIWAPNRDIIGVDPETNLTGASNGRGLEYFNNPGTRSYVFSLKLTY